MFVYGQDFGNQEIQHLIPELPDPDYVALTLQTNCQPSLGCFLKSASKTLLYYLPILLVRANTPNPLTPSLALTIVPLLLMLLSALPQTAWAEDITTY